MKKTVKFVHILLFLICGTALLSSCDPKDKAPAVPTGLTTGDITDVSAVLSWSGEAADYEVVVGEGAAKVVTGKSYTATGLSAETNYTWKVRAKDGDLYSEWVDGPAFKTAATEVVNPDAPTDPNVTDITDTAATFTWGGTATSYEINVGEITETVNAKTFTATGLTPETPYEWKVRAVAGELASDWVDGPDFTTLAPQPPAAPTGLEVSNIGRTSATLKWEGTTVAYELELYDGLFQSADTTRVEAKGIDLTTLRAGTIYDWRVRAVEGDLVSSWVDGEQFTTGMSSLTGDVVIGSIMVQGVAEYYGDSYANGNNTFRISLGTKTETEGTFELVMLEMYTPAGDGLSIPEGTYPINDTLEAGTLNKGQLAGGIIPIGSVYMNIVNQAASAMAPFHSGQAVVTRDGSRYRIEVQATDDIGYSITGAYEGELEFQDKRP